MNARQVHANEPVSDGRNFVCDICCACAHVSNHTIWRVKSFRPSTITTSENHNNFHLHRNNIQHKRTHLHTTNCNLYVKMISIHGIWHRFHTATISRIVARRSINQSHTSSQTHLIGQSSWYSSWNGTFGSFRCGCEKLVKWFISYGIWSLTLAKMCFF